MVTRCVGTSSASSASTNGKGPILPRKDPNSLDKKTGQEADTTITKSKNMIGINGVAGGEGEGPGRAKRKARKPAIKDESSEDSDTPLVSLFLPVRIHGLEVSVEALDI